MKRSDMHVHTEATAPYQQGDSNLAPYHERGASAALDFMGISDHYHYFWQKTRYVRAQRAAIDAAKFTSPTMYLGVEQTILSKSGRIGIRDSGLEGLDYVILAIHWMPVGGRLGHEEIEAAVATPQRLEKLIAIAKQYYKRAMTNPRLARVPKIIGHPFNFLLPQHANAPGVIDALDWLCKTCAEHQVAYEINKDVLPRDLSSIDPAHDATWKALAIALDDNKPPVSIGSDAHKLDNIGTIDPILSCMAHYNVDSSLLLDERFLARDFA